MNPTPPPWTQIGSQIVGGDNGRVIACLTDSHGNDLNLREPEWTPAMLHGKMLVRAVNCHDELLAACQQARACLLNLMPEDKNPMQKQMQKMVGELSKAIEKAEGE